MKQKNLTFILSLVIFLSLSSVMPAEASTVIRSGETVSLVKDETVDGDFYAGARQVNISGQINGDLVSAGVEVGINGNVQDDMFILADKTDVHGTVGDDLRILARSAIISEPVAGDVFMFGGSLKILSTATIGGSVIFFGEEATIEGHVVGDVLGSVKRMRIDSQVDGGVDMTVDQLTLGGRANIVGNVKYVSWQGLIQSPETVVGGETLRNDPLMKPVKDENLMLDLFVLLILLFSTLVWYWLSRNTVQKITEHALEFKFKYLLLGFSAFLFLPLASLILMTSLIGLFIGLISLLAYLMLSLLVVVLLPAVIGQLLVRSFSKNSSVVNSFTAFIGTAGILLCLLVPFVGHLVLVGFFLLVLGAIVDLLINKVSKQGA